MPDTASAALALKRTTGNILLTTGSNTVGEYTRVIPAERVWVRVLPTVSAIEKCAAAGVLSSHIIAMQGPFSNGLNAALYEHFSISVMVTKDSGKPAGMDEKVIPALEKDIHVIFIDRPREDLCAENH